jgi:hypothetical protein
MKDLPSSIVYPEKPNDAVPAFSMRYKSGVHLGDNCEEIDRTDGVIRAVLTRNSSNQHQMLIWIGVQCD